MLMLNTLLTFLMTETVGFSDKQLHLLTGGASVMEIFIESGSGTY